MIKIEDIVLKPDVFGDGTLKCEAPTLKDIKKEELNITWCYDNDTELFALFCAVRHIQETYNGKINLIMPYIPHARQDRYVSNRLFTLKYFAEIINSLNFSKVYALDPHSKSSFNLIHNLEELPLPFGVSFAKDYAIMFPDKGAAEKYQSRYVLDATDKPFIIGEKHRNSNGYIDKYELKNFTPGIKGVIIRDDICSYGGTFVAAAEELKKRGVQKIILVVSHCENNILKGNVFDYIDTVFTTDSICTIEHPKLIVSHAYRKLYDIKDTELLKKKIKEYLKNFCYISNPDDLSGYVDYDIAYDLRPDINRDFGEMDTDEYQLLVEETILPFLRSFGAINEDGDDDE